MSEEEAALLAQIEESATIADSEAAQAAGESDSPRTKETGRPSEKLSIDFRRTPSKFRLRAQSSCLRQKRFALRAGGCVKLTVQATTKAERVLYSAARARSHLGYVSKSSREKFGDSREGGSTVALSPGPAIEFSRTWPNAGEKASLREKRWSYMWASGASARTKKTRGRCTNSSS